MAEYGFLVVMSSTLVGLKVYKKGMAVAANIYVPQNISNNADADSC